MSSVGDTMTAVDLSGQGRTLTNNNNVPYGVYGLQSYASPNGVNSYLSRTMEPGLAITGNLTFGLWVRFKNAPATNESVIGSWDNFLATKAYRIRRTVTTGIVQGWMTQDGSTQQQSNGAGYTGTAYAPAVNEWAFCACRFTSGNLSMIVNTNVTYRVIAETAIYSATTPFTLGLVYNNSVPNWLPCNCDVALAFICAAYVSEAQLTALYSLTRPLFYGT
jgi:hypothetical protein